MGRGKAYIGWRGRRGGEEEGEEERRLRREQGGAGKVGQWPKGVARLARGDRRQRNTNKGASGLGF